MNQIKGNIVDVIGRTIKKGTVYFEEKIIEIIYSEDISEQQYILPGFIDAHVHIESSMLTPIEYSKIALKHGVIAAVTDPHEIANVCGIKGVLFMANNAVKSPMKIYLGAPSCVPATSFESSGATLNAFDIDRLFNDKVCSHLSEMMNFPGVIYDDKYVVDKLKVAKKYHKKIDGHAPLLSGSDLIKYVNSGISTDHECTNLAEAREKISLGMKIMLRNSSAAKDFINLLDLVNESPNDVMFCTDDCHPDDLLKGYINAMVKYAIQKGYNLFDVLSASSKNVIKHYDLNVGLLQTNDPADFVVLDSLDNFSVLSTYINGKQVYNANEVNVIKESHDVINTFYANSVSENDIKIPNIGKSINVIEIVPDSLLTNKFIYKFNNSDQYLNSNIDDDILKVIVLNRYQKAKPSVGFIKGYGLKNGAIAGTIAHDSHNIIAVGVSDASIINVINKIQEAQGGLVVSDDETTYLLELPVGGLMSNQCCEMVAEKYSTLNKIAKGLGSTLNAPFMTLAFMSLLVIPELKIGDKGLFDVTQFAFIDLQN